MEIFDEIRSTCREAKLSSSIPHGQFWEMSISNVNIPSSLNGTLWEDGDYTPPWSDTKFW